MTKMYLITNPDYHSKKVVAEDMEQALYKYREYVEKTLSYDYSVDEVISKITKCEYYGDYEMEDILM